jgi:hypothetical protein
VDPLTTQPTGRHRVAVAAITALAIAAVILIAATGCTAGSHLTDSVKADSGKKGSPVHEPTESAGVYRDQAIQLITDIAAAVAPGSTPTPLDGAVAVGPAPCTAPLKGLYYYSIGRQFDGPTGSTGADLIPAITDQLRQRGFQINPLGTHGPELVLGAATQWLDLSVMGAIDGPSVRIAIDSRCGTNPDNPPSPTATTPTPPPPL